MSYEVKASLELEGVSKFTKGFNEVADTVSKFQTKVKDTLGKLPDGFKKVGNGVVNLSSKMGKGLAIAGAAVGAGVAAGAAALGVFGVKAIQAAGEMDVVNAQFEQMSGDQLPQATKMINNMGKEWNMLPNRLKPAISTFQAFFKQTGKDGPEALDATSKAMKIAADGAAFMDISMEEATRALKSTMMGNYEAADALGVNISATKLATAYNKEYGGSWDDLNDAAKSDFLVEYIQNMYDASDITGQAVREQNSLANVTANLRSGFDTLIATVGTPFLQPILDAAAKLTPLFQVLADKVEAFFKTAEGQATIKAFSDVVNVLADNIARFITDIDIGAIAQKFVQFAQSLSSGGIKETLQGIVDGFVEFWNIMKPIIPVLTQALPQIVAGFIGFSAISPVVSILKLFGSGINMIKGAFTLLSPIFTKITPLFKLFGSALKSIIPSVISIATSIGSALIPIFSAVASFVTGTLIPTIVTLVSTFALPIAIITAVIAVGVLLYKNWETVTEYAGILWNKIKEVFNGIVQSAFNMAQGVTQWFGDMASKVGATVSKMISSVKQWFSDMGAKISSTVKSIVDKVKTGFDNAKTSAINAVTNLKDKVVSTFQNVVTSVKSKISSMVSNVVNLFTSMYNKMMSIMQNIKSRIISTFTSMVSGARNAVSKLVGAVSGVMNDVLAKVKGFFSVFKTAGSSLVGMIADGIKGAVSKVTGAISSVVGKVRDFLPFSPAKTGPLSDLDRLNFGGTISTGIYKGEKEVQEAMNDIMHIPDFNTPMLRLNGAAKRTAQDVNYDMQSMLNVTVHNELNGREIARGTQKDMTTEQTRVDRLRNRSLGYRTI